MEEVYDQHVSLCVRLYWVQFELTGTKGSESVCM
jgi:hypothetical protein